MTLTESSASKNSIEKPVVIAQITDCHLFASMQGLHCGTNVAENLKQVLLNIAENPAIDCIIFTGDLTQDHSELSYQNFVDCVQRCELDVPIYWVAGNHDEPELLSKYLSKPPFVEDKEILLEYWQVQLVDSKTETPAGYVSKQSLTLLQNKIRKDKSQLLMMHHHPIDVGYFIDKHGLQNKTEFWQTMSQFDNIKGIACGHVHGAQELTYPLQENIKQASAVQTIDAIKPPVTLFTCPATSIQFDPNVDGVGALDLGPGYRVFYLYPDGKLQSDVVFL